MQPDVVKSAAFKHNHAHHLNKPGYRVETRNPFGPFGHAVDWSEQTTHQNKNHDEEKCQRHGLLLRVGVS